MVSIAQVYHKQGLLSRAGLLRNLLVATELNIYFWWLCYTHQAQTLKMLEWIAQMGVAHPPVRFCFSFGAQKLVTKI